MKKLLTGIFMVSMITSIPAFALATNERSREAKGKIKIEFRHHKENKQEDREDKDKEDRNDDKKATSTANIVGKVTVAQVNTYSDVSNILAGFATTTKSIRLMATTTASTTLSSGELALYAKLTPGTTKAERVNAGADSVLAHINALQTLVSPLGSQTISANFNLKEMIVRELNRIGSQINNLARVSLTIK